MANWKETLNIANLHESFNNDEIEIASVAKLVHERCMKLKCAKEEEFEAIISELLMIDDVEDYDGVLGNIYDYGDTGHRLWIKTA